MVGPILQSKYPELSPVLFSFLNSHDSTLYIALGTYWYMPPSNNVILLEAALELLASKKINGVVWSLGHTAVEDLPSTITTSYGTLINISSFLENKHPDIYAFQWMPQS